MLPQDTSCLFQMPVITHDISINLSRLFRAILIKFASNTAVEFKVLQPQNAVRPVSASRKKLSSAESKRDGTLLSNETRIRLENALNQSKEITRIVTTLNETVHSKMSGFIS
jgi:hypothetical protein